MRRFEAGSLQVTRMRELLAARYPADTERCSTGYVPAPEIVRLLRARLGPRRVERNDAGSAHDEGREAMATVSHWSTTWEGGLLHPGQAHN